MAYVPNSNSVVAFQSDQTKLLADVGGLNKPTGSVTGNPVYVGGIDANGSVVGARAVTVVTIGAGDAFLGLSSVSGAVTAPPGSVMAISGTITPSGNQSVSGAITAPPGSVMATNQLAGSILATTGIQFAGSILATSAIQPAGSLLTIITPAGSVQGVRTDSASVITVWKDSSVITTWKDSSVIALQLAGSVLATSATVTPAANQSVSGAVTFPSGSVAAVRTDNASVITVWKDSSVIAMQLAGSVLATSATLLPGSVSGAVTAPPGSVMQVRTDSASVITTQPAGSIMAVSAVQPAGSLLSAIQVAGSVMAVSATQGTTPWIIGSVYGNISGSVAAIQAGTWNVSVAGQVTNVSSVYAVLSSITTVSVMVANTTRKAATIFNAAGTTVFIKLGTAATTSVYTVLMNPNDYYEVPGGWNGVVAGISNSNAGILNVTELN